MYIIVKQNKNIQIKIQTLKGRAPGMAEASKPCVKSDVFFCFQLEGVNFSLFQVPPRKRKDKWHVQ